MSGYVMIEEAKTPHQKDEVWINPALVAAVSETKDGHGLIYLTGLEKPIETGWNAVHCVHVLEGSS